MSTRKWIDRLVGAGHRVTGTRETVLEILSQTPHHLTAEEIYLRALNLKPSIGLTTVYRTLEMFVRLGVAQKFDVGDGKARYELLENPAKKDHHHHLICVQCKKIVDYADFVHEENELMDKTEAALERRYQFKIMNHSIHFYGLCLDCQSEF